MTGDLQISFKIIDIERAFLHPTLRSWILYPDCFPKPKGYNIYYIQLQIFKVLKACYLTYMHKWVKFNQ